MQQPHILNPATNQSSSLMGESPWKVIRENTGNFISGAIHSQDKGNLVVLTTKTGFQLRFTCYSKTERVEEWLAKYFA